MATLSTKRIVFIVVVSCLVWFAAPVVVLLEYDRRSLPGRVTDNAKSHLAATYADFLSTEDLVSVSEDGPFGLNGDSSIHGTFQLSATEMNAFLKSDAPLKCATSENCTISKNGGDNAYYGKEGRDRAFSLYIDVATNQIRWTYDWY